MSPIVYAALMPHSPWLIPEVGGGRERPAVRTIASARRIGRELAALTVDTVVVLTPHAPPTDGRAAVYRAPLLRAGFAEYGVPELLVERETDTKLAAALVEQGVGAIDATEIDRGLAVPLYFAARGLGAARLLGVGVPALTQIDDRTELARLGALIARVAGEHGRSIALFASGELSHRLFAGAPRGFEPRAELFDATVQDAVAAGDLDGLATLPRELVEAVDEHALATIAVVAGALRGLPLLRHADAGAGSYEAPFGVGQLVATLYRV